MSVGDADAGTADIRVTLTVTGGRVALAITSSLTVTGDDSALVNLTGPMAAVNAALATLTFTPTTNFNGAASIQVLADDQGHTPGPANDPWPWSRESSVVGPVSNRPAWTGRLETGPTTEGSQFPEPVSHGFSRSPAQLRHVSPPGVRPPGRLPHPTESRPIPASGCDRGGRRIRWVEQHRPLPTATRPEPTGGASRSLDIRPGGRGWTRSEPRSNTSP